jgi:hypothetical protein
MEGVQEETKEINMNEGKNVSQKYSGPVGFNR